MVLAYQKSRIRLGLLKSANESLTRMVVYISLMTLYIPGGSKVKTPITDTCIVVYMWHLYRKMQENMLLQDFRLVDPVSVEYVPSRNQNIDFIQEQLNKRASYLASRLIGTSTGQLVVVSCNIGFHWILTILNVEKEIVYLLDPLRHRIHDQDWKYVVNIISVFQQHRVSSISVFRQHRFQQHRVSSIVFSNIVSRILSKILSKKCPSSSSSLSSI